MDQEKNKIPSPFQAPDGYFDGFEAKLEARMSPAKGQPVMRVQRNIAPVPQQKEKRPVMEWVAVAATVTVLAVSGYMVFLKTGTDEVPVPMAQAPKPVLKVETPVEVPPSPEVIEDQVVAVMMEEAEETTTPVKQVVLTRKEAATAAELEEAGLIVLETNDGLFDQFEL